MADFKQAGESAADQSLQMVKKGSKVKTQKDLDKELRRQYDKGKAYDEDEDDKEARRHHEAENIEDDKFEALLRDYNDQTKKKLAIINPNDPNQESTGPANLMPALDSLIDKPIDLPFYKCIQLPEHLKWMNVHGVSFFHLP